MSPRVPAYDGQDSVAGCASGVYPARSARILARDGSARVGVVELPLQPLLPYHLDPRAKQLAAAARICVVCCGWSAG